MYSVKYNFHVGGRFWESLGYKIQSVENCIYCVIHERLNNMETGLWTGLLFNGILMLGQ